MRLDSKSLPVIVFYPGMVKTFVVHFFLRFSMYYIILLSIFIGSVTGKRSPLRYGLICKVLRAEIGELNRTMCIDCIVISKLFSLHCYDGNDDHDYDEEM